MANVFLRTESINTVMGLMRPLSTIAATPNLTHQSSRNAYWDTQGGMLNQAVVNITGVVMVTRELLLIVEGICCLTWNSSFAILLMMSIALMILICQHHPQLYLNE